MTDHRNVVRQNYFRDIGDVMLVRNLFRLIRVINRTNSRPIWTPTCEDIDHNAKITSFTLPKKNPHVKNVERRKSDLFQWYICGFSCFSVEKSLLLSLGHLQIVLPVVRQKFFFLKFSTESSKLHCKSIFGIEKEKKHLLQFARG